MEHCPRCMGTEIRLFADKSGWCMRCNMPFMRAISDQPPQAGSVGGIEGQGVQPDTAEVSSGSAAVAAPAMPMMGQSAHGGDQVVYGVPVGIPMPGPWIGMESPHAEQDAWAEDERATSARIIICIGSAICMAAVLLGALLGMSYFIRSSAGSFLCLGAFAEIGLAAAAFGAGIFIKDNTRRSSTIALVIGAVLVVLSLLLMGGILGIIGAVLIFTGGLITYEDH